MGRMCTWVAGFAVFFSAPAPALAHLDLVSPVSRYGPDELKTAPCGVEGGERSGNVTVFEPGETIEIRWVEYVQHPGHYRIAFDADGDDDFVDPATMMEMYSNDAVLLDGIEDTGDADYRVTVTLPEVTCDECTLQVVQVMYDKPPYTIPGDDLYYQCADLVLREADASSASDAPTAGGCSTHRPTQSQAVWILCLIAWAARRLARPADLPL